MWMQSDPVNGFPWVSKRSRNTKGFRRRPESDGDMRRVMGRDSLRGSVAMRISAQHRSSFAIYIDIDIIELNRRRVEEGGAGMQKQQDTSGYVGWCSGRRFAPWRFVRRTA